MTQVVPASEARSRFLRLVEAADRRFDRFVVTRNGRPEAVLMSFHEYEGWLETLDIQRDPATVKALEEGMKDYHAGRLHSFEQVVGRPQRRSRPR